MCLMNCGNTILAGILYKCRSGCQWAMLPACYGSKSTVHEHFQRWSKAGVMTEIFRILLAEYGEKKKQRLRGLAATRRTEGEVAARFISMWTVRVFLWE